MATAPALRQRPLPPTRKLPVALKMIILLQSIMVVACRPFVSSTATAALVCSSSHDNTRNNHRNNNRHRNVAIFLRGGDSESSSEDDDDSESSEDGESSSSESDDDASKSDDPLSTVISSEPVKVLIKTNLGNPLVDHSLELLVARTRNVSSIKQSISRQMAGRPPMSTQTLLWGSHTLSDDQLVDELVDDDDDDDEDDDDESILTLYLDSVPPIDPKFATDMAQKLKDMTTSEIFNAYVTNQAAMYHNAQTLYEPTDSAVRDNANNNDNDNGDVYQSQERKMALSVTLRQEAYQMRQDLCATFDDKVLDVLEQNDASSAQDGASAIERRGQRTRTAGQKGGSKANVRRILQRNLNINWPDTIRNFFLFLFFGLFGGRSTVSKHLLVLGAPACFILQARPVKILIKQLFYSLAHPPSIFLSLLPAPQQAILSFDPDAARHVLYGTPQQMPNDNAPTDVDDDDDESEEEESEEEESEEGFDSVFPEESDDNYYDEDDTDY